MPTSTMKRKAATKSSAPKKSVKKDLMARRTESAAKFFPYTE
jgi:hypothetical protein